MATDEEASNQQRNHLQAPRNETVSNLLSLWGLTELSSKFKSHEVDYRSLLCLNEKDICELIPKIGRRAIFRSNLIEWRKRNLNNNSNRRRRDTQPMLRIAATVSATPPNEDDTSSNEVIVTNEATAPNNQESNKDGSPNNDETPTNTATVVKNEQYSDYESEEISDNIQNPSDDMNCLDEMETEEDDGEIEAESLDNQPCDPPETKKFNVTFPPPMSKKSYTECLVDVNQILSSTREGRQIISYYEVHGSFDYCHRRRLVTLIINEVVQQNRWLSQDDFSKMSKDIIQLFPREDIATYYTARNGLKNPKGCLYNKFLNLTRKLRQEGVLQYRNNIQLIPERISARHYGAVKSYKNNF